MNCPIAAGAEARVSVAALPSDRGISGTLWGKIGALHRGGPEGPILPRGRSRDHAGSMRRLQSPYEFMLLDGWPLVAAADVAFASCIAKAIFRRRRAGRVLR